MMILLWLHSTKDELYYYVIKLNKSAVKFLRKNFELIDKYVPIKQNEQVLIKQINSLN